MIGVCVLLVMTLGLIAAVARLLTERDEMRRRISDLELLLEVGEGRARDLALALGATADDPARTLTLWEYARVEQARASGEMTVPSGGDGQRSTCAPRGSST